jgi:hypothetical protein
MATAIFALPSILVIIVALQSPPIIASQLLTAHAILAVLDHI